MLFFTVLGVGELDLLRRIDWAYRGSTHMLQSIMNCSSALDESRVIKKVYKTIKKI